MNGLWLALPFLAVRFLLPFALDREALRRAARFADVYKRQHIYFHVIIFRFTVKTPYFDGQLFTGKNL